MGALGERVDAGIGSSRSLHAHRLGTNQLESCFEPILNPLARGLALPSRERRAVVGDNQLEPRRHLILSRRIQPALGFETACRL